MKSGRQNEQAVEVVPVAGGTMCGGVRMQADCQRSADAGAPLSVHHPSDSSKQACNCSNDQVHNQLQNAVNEGTIVIDYSQTPLSEWNALQR